MSNFSKNTKKVPKNAKKTQKKRKKQQNLQKSTISCGNGVKINFTRRGFQIIIDD